jgi:hypothetical protein
VFIDQIIKELIYNKQLHDQQRPYLPAIRITHCLYQHPELIQMCVTVTYSGTIRLDL